MGGSALKAVKDKTKRGSRLSCPSLTIDYSEECRDLLATSSIACLYEDVILVDDKVINQSKESELPTRNVRPRADKRTGAVVSCRNSVRLVDERLIFMIFSDRSVSSRVAPHTVTRGLPLAGTSCLLTCREGPMHTDSPNPASPVRGNLLEAKPRVAFLVLVRITAHLLPMTEPTQRSLVVPPNEQPYVHDLSVKSLHTIFGGHSRSGVVLGVPVKKGYQITLFYDPNSKGDWNSRASHLVCWLQSPTESLDQPVHGPAVLMNEMNGELRDLSLSDYNVLQAMADELEAAAEQ